MLTRYAYDPKNVYGLTCLDSGEALERREIVVTLSDLAPLLARVMALLEVYGTQDISLDMYTEAQRLLAELKEMQG